MRILSCIAVLFRLFTLPLVVTAQGPPVFSDTPIMLGLEGRGLRTFGKFTDREGGKSYVQVFAVPYNVNARFQVGGILPLMWASPTGGRERSGLSDLSLFLKHQLWQKDGLGNTFRGLLKLTQSFPTGDTSAEPPLGSGAYQTTLSLVMGHIATTQGFYLETGYAFVGEDRPNAFLLNFAFSRPLLPQRYPPKQINLSVDILSRLAGENQTSLLISPAIQWIAGRKLLFEGGVQIPLREVDTTDTRFILLFGTRVLLF